MACFTSLVFWEQVCILIVVAIAVYRLWNLISPFLMQFLPALVVGIIQIVIWLFIAIFCIHILFEFIGCLFGAGGLNLGRPFH
jgi:hypothetical protein